MTDIDALELDESLFDEPETSEEEEEVAAIPLPAEPKFRITKGKYKGLILPRMIGVKPSHLDRVLALKAEIEADPEFTRYASSIAATYAELRREAARLAADLSDVKTRLTAAMLLMIDQMEIEGTSSMTLDNGDKLRVQPEPHLIVKDKEAFRRWCLEQQLDGDMVLPWAKANKLLKEMLIAGEEEPPGAECFARSKIIFTQGQK